MVDWRERCSAAPLGRAGECCTDPRTVARLLDGTSRPLERTATRFATGPISDSPRVMPGTPRRAMFVALSGARTQLGAVAVQCPVRNLVHTRFSDRLSSCVRVRSGTSLARISAAG